MAPARLSTYLSALAEGHRRPRRRVEPAAPLALEREGEGGVLLLLERLHLSAQVHLLVEGEHNPGELLLPAEVPAVLLGDADGELVGGGAGVLAPAPWRAAPRGGLVEVVGLVAVERLHGAPRQADLRPSPPCR